MVERIIEIFEKYGTDKNSTKHNYGPYYAKHLPESPKKILEIGVLKGESIKMWHEIFPEAHIFGLDLFQDNPEPFQEDWVTWIKGSQVDYFTLHTVRELAPFDVIIDDGSHNWRDQLITFFGLWGCCDLYVVEDIFTDNFWSQGLPLEDNIKFLNPSAKIYNYETIKFFFAP
jgi:hypothetical protein